MNQTNPQRGALSPLTRRAQWIGLGLAFVLGASVATAVSPHHGMTSATEPAPQPLPRAKRLSGLDVRQLDSEEVFLHDPSVPDAATALAGRRLAAEPTAPSF